METNLNDKIKYLHAKTEEIEIPDDNPFKNDRLGRQPDARRLMIALNRYKKGAVFALDSSWGTGKSTFVKMLAKYLKLYKFPVVSYNAWENDLSDEPLTSMLGQMNTLNNEDGLDEVFRIGAKVVVGALAGGLVELNPMGRFLKGFVKGGVKQIENRIYDSLKEGNSKTKLLNDFREAFESYVRKVCGIVQLKEEENSDFKPMVYIIDELDRCNPIFAVKVLERIKHLFEVPNVVFILVIDKHQLAYSINGFYGSDKIDSMEYLEKYIDYDYRLPRSYYVPYLNYLFEYYNFNEVVELKQAKNNGFLIYARAVCDLFKPSLRKTEKIMTLVRFVYDSLEQPTEYDRIIFFIAFLRVQKPDLFNQIESYSLTLQELVDALDGLYEKPSVLQNHFATSNDYNAIVSELIFNYAKERGIREIGNVSLNSLISKDKQSLLITVNKLHSGDLLKNILASNTVKLEKLFSVINLREENSAYDWYY